MRSADRGESVVSVSGEVVAHQSVGLLIVAKEYGQNEMPTEGQMDKNVFLDCGYIGDSHKHIRISSSLPISFNRV